MRWLLPSLTIFIASYLTIIEWPISQLRAIDRKAQKIISKHKATIGVQRWRGCIFPEAEAAEDCNQKKKHGNGNKYPWSYIWVRPTTYGYKRS